MLTVLPLSVPPLIPKVSTRVPLSPLAVNVLLAAAKPSLNAVSV